jgi:16S rRNA processing protein RimM
MPLLEVGQVVRPHGLRGEVVVELVTNLSQRLDQGSVLVGGGRELVVEGARAVPGRLGPTGGRWVVRFAGLKTRDEAEALRGTILQAEPMSRAEGLWVHEVIGCVVVDGESGVPVGTVVSVEANPASDLLVLDSGVLVPLHFVTGSAPGRLTVEAPPGLFEL